MQIDALGSPVLTEGAHVAEFDLFLDRLADAVYGRLPRFARLFLSRDALRALLGLAGDEIAKRSGF